MNYRTNKKIFFLSSSSLTVPVVLVQSVDSDWLFPSPLQCVTRPCVVTVAASREGVPETQVRKCKQTKIHKDK